MKTFDRKDVYSVLNAEEARSYINKDGFFADTLSYLNALVRQNCFEILDDVNQLHDFPFITCGKGSLFFLPADKVKEVEEKKWRAFNNHEELAKTLGIETKSLIGTKITWRNKGNGITVGQALIINVFSNKEESCITLGLVNYSMEKLFFELELNKDGVWQPFGVEE